MAKDNQIPQIPADDDWFAREERCHKALKAVSKAIFMRLFAASILIWAVIRTDMELWVMGLMALVLLITLAGMLPLVQEYKRLRAERKAILAEEE